MIIQKIAMDSSSGKTAEAQNCGGKCSRESSEQVNLDVAWTIGANCYKKKLIAKNASKIKQQIHTHIQQLIEILVERERELNLAVDEECINQFETVDNVIAKISGHCCNTVSDAVLNKSDRSYEKDSNYFPVIKFDFKSNLDDLKPQLKKFGNLSLRDCNGYDYVQLPRAPVVQTTAVTPTFEKWKKFNKKMEWFFRFVANDDELAKRMSGNQTADLNCRDELYEMDYRNFEKSDPIVQADDDIEIISENEVAGIPSEHTPRRKLFSGKRSLPLLPCGIFWKNPKDVTNVEVEKQNTKLESESPVPCSSSIIPNPESNVEVLAHNKENKNSVEYCISTEAKKNQVPSAALASSLFEHFNNNKEEWLASKDDSDKWLTSKSTSQKWLCPKDSSDKHSHSEKKIGQWLPHKENPDGGSWLSENQQ